MICPICFHHMSRKDKMCTHCGTSKDEIQEMCEIEKEENEWPEEDLETYRLLDSKNGTRDALLVKSNQKKNGSRKSKHAKPRL